MTHTLLGVTLANAGPRQWVGGGAVVVLAATSNLPDLDALWSFAGVATATLERRTFTHSVVGVPLLCLAAAAVFARLYPDLRFRTLYVLCLLGSAVHVAFDMVNSFGVALLSPWSARRFELAVVFPVDAVMLALLALPLAWWWALHRRGVEAHRSARRLTVGSRLALGLVAAYLGLCALGHGLAERALDRYAAREGLEASFTYVVPEPLGPNRWTGLISSRGVYRVALIHAFADRVVWRRTVLSMVGDPRVEQVLAAPVGERVAAFLRVPVWRAERSRVTVYDLRFRYQALGNDWDPFRFRFDLDGGQVRLLEWTPAEIAGGIRRVVTGGAGQHP